VLRRVRLGYWLSVDSREGSNEISKVVVVVVMSVAAICDLMAKPPWF
jgi:hypothetical protein